MKKPLRAPWLVELTCPIDTLRDRLGEVVATYRPAGWRVKEIRLSRQSYKALTKALGQRPDSPGLGEILTFQRVPVVQHAPDFDEVVLEQGLEQGPEQGEEPAPSPLPQAGGPQGHGSQSATPTRAGAG